MSNLEKEEAKVVIVDYQELLENPSPENVSLSTRLEKAYGSNSSLGVLAIRNVPGFVAVKKKFLPMAHTLAHLPQDYLQNHLTDESSMYNAGWSHGKEKLGDKPDWAKGSFYFNPLTDKPGSEEDRTKYPASYPCNLWPSSQIPDFEANATQLGTLMKDVVVLLAKHLDAFALEQNPNYPADTLYNAMKNTEKAKGRLLYYFPLDKEQAPSEDSWIGWHNDSGFLTALAGDMYVNDETGQEIAPPDPNAGLYVVDRNDSVVHVSLPSDCMAVQMGECVQILTGGCVVATPHCVRGAMTTDSNVSVARISLPCFIDAPPSFPLVMPPGSCTRDQVLSAGVGTSRVPPLSARWTSNGMTFGDFLQKTFSLYYDWSSGAGASNGDKGES